MHREIKTAGDWLKTATKIMNIFSKVKQIAEANKDGFTISLLDFQTPKKGYCVAMKMTQDSFGDEGLKRVIEVAMQSTYVVGGWYESESGRFYYDCVMIVDDLQTALSLGRANEQLAIFDIGNAMVIEL